MRPYRTPAELAEPADEQPAEDANWDLRIGLGVLFIASVVRVVAAFARGEAWGTEPTLALLLVLWVLGGLLVGLGRRARGLTKS